MKKQKILVAYHTDCIDGFTSCWVTVRALQEEGHTVDTIALEPGDGHLLIMKLERREYKRLFIVDFSLPIYFLQDIERRFPALETVLLDHHKTAFENYAPYIKVKETSKEELTISSAKIVLNNDECGASMCWRWFHGKDSTRLPKLICYVKDHDLWRFKLGDETKWMNKFLVDHDKTFRIWDALYEGSENPKVLELFLEEGKELQYAHDVQVAEIVKLAQPITLAGKTGLGVECPRSLRNEVGHALATKCGTFGAMLDIDEKCKLTVYSLRSNEDYDVSAIAKQFGGGGHKNAAGFHKPFDVMPSKRQEPESE